MVVDGGLLHIDCHIHLNCVQGILVDEGGLLHIHLKCVHRQIHVYDAIGSLACSDAYRLVGPLKANEPKN